MALDRGREFDLSAARMAFEPATRVSPQSPSPASELVLCLGLMNTDSVIFRDFGFGFNECVGCAL